jgi:hypothetical protein
MLCAAGLPVLGADDPATASAPPDVEKAPAPVEASAAGAIPRETEELLVAAQRDPAAIGPLSIGTPDAGLLLNPVPFPEGSLWTVRDPRESWGTDETIGYIVTAIESRSRRLPWLAPRGDRRPQPKGQASTSTARTRRVATRTSASTTGAAKRIRS